MHASRLAVLALAAAALLAACAKEEAAAPAPLARAGVDQEAWKGAPVTLDGSGSTGALAYAWRQVEGPVVVLADDHQPRPVFTAPQVGGALRFSLVVSAGAVASAPDEVIVLVRNRAPSADAGPDLAAPVGQVVTLDASASTDPDGDLLAATWFQRAGPAVALASHPDGSASFTAPAAGAALEFGLVVSDGEATSEVSAVRVLVVDEGANWPPVARAGADQEVARRAVVHLQGSAEDRERDPIAWSWLQVAGPAVSLLGADGPAPSFVAPADEADLEFQLVVADALGTGSDRVLVRVRNQPPALGPVTLSPAAPVTTDPLVASVTAADADQDPITLTWAWRRNGELLAGQAGPTLPASLTTRGDVFVVTVTADDGARSATAEASVTIQDAPPVLHLSAPATATWGQPYAFTVTAEDPDGDPVGGVVLLHGPAGMVVTQAGAGSWTPSQPMLDETLEVSFAVGAAGLPGSAASAAVALQDPGRGRPVYRSGIEIPVLQHGLVAADLDADGRAELLVAGSSGLFELAFEGGGYAQRWGHPFADGGTTLRAVDARDLDGDGHPEIFFSATGPDWSSTPSGALVVLDGATRRERARAGLACRDLELGDLDRDGAPELVCLEDSGWTASNTRLLVLDAATLAERWRSADLGLGAGVALGNVDLDPALEIVAAGGWVFDGASGANQWAASGGFGAAVDTGDLDGDGVEEIVGMDAWSRFRGFSAVLRSPLWEQATFDSDALLVQDVDGDGVTEIVVGDGQWGNVTGWRYRPATNDLAQAFALDSQDHGVTSIAAADLDGDGVGELAWGSGATSSGADVFVVAGLGPPMALEWTSRAMSQLDGPFLGARPARTAAGAPPAILFQIPQTNSGYAGTRLARLDPASGLVQTSVEIGTNWSHAGALDVADVDGDGVDEALLSTAALYDDYLVAWDFAAGAAEWSTTPGSGGARAITHADLNGDGHPELVAIGGDGYVSIHDVAGAALLWRSTSLGVGIDVEVADVDGDGQPELVALASERLVLFRRAGGPVPWLEAAAVAAGGSDLAVSDCDGDGRPEVYVLAGGGVDRYDGALAPRGRVVLATEGTALSLFVEELGFPRKNLLVGTGEQYVYYGSPSRLEAMDPFTGALVWRSPPLHGVPAVNSLGLADLRGDGERALFFGTGSGMYLTAPHR